MKTEGFAFDVEVLVRARQSGLEIVEVPIEWSDAEESRVQLLRDGLRMLWVVLTLPRSG